MFGLQNYTVKELARILNLTEQTIRKYLCILDQADKILKIDKTHRSYRYMIDLDLVYSLED